MADKKRQDLNSHAVPFFARYLEGQLEELSDEEAEAVGGGGGGKPTTRKWPSDNDEDGGGGFMITEKWPSNKEDDPVAMTMKYPSDTDE